MAVRHATIQIDQENCTSSVIGTAAGSETITGNTGNNTVTLVGAATSAVTGLDTIQMGAGEDDYV